MAVQHHLGAVKVRINYMHLNLSVIPLEVKKSALQFVLWLQVSPHKGPQGAHGIDDNILGILRLENSSIYCQVWSCLSGCILVAVFYV